MTRVACIGSVAIVALWKLAETLAPAVRRGQLQSTLFGNDAVIVAGELADRGFDVSCVILAPTDADMNILCERLPRCRAFAIDEIAGAETRTLCLENADGMREWVFPRSPSVGTTPPQIETDAVYIDYYREFRPYVQRHLKAWYRGDGPLLLNLSDLSPLDQIPRLGFEPTVVQASVDVDPNRACAIATSIQQQTGAELAIVTSGSTGAAFATSQSSAHRRPATRLANGGSVLGAGAVFSATVLEAVLDLGAQSDRLPDEVIARIAERLPRLEGHAYSRP